MHPTAPRTHPVHPRPALALLAAATAVIAGCNGGPDLASGSATKEPGNGGANPPNTPLMFPRTVDANMITGVACSLAVVTSSSTSGIAVSKNVPAVCYISPDMTSLYYAESKDEYGSAWNPRQLIASAAGDDTITECCLIDAGGRPGVAYVLNRPEVQFHSPSYSYVKFIRYFALDGWKRYPAAGDDPDTDEFVNVPNPSPHTEYLSPEYSYQILGLSAAVIDGHPAIAYFTAHDEPQDSNNDGLAYLPCALRYVRALDNQGTMWGDLEPKEGSGQGSRKPFSFVHPSTSLVEISEAQGGLGGKVQVTKPMIGFCSGDKLGLSFPTGEMYDNGSVVYPQWTSQIIDDDDAQTGGFASLAVVLGRPAMSYRDASGVLQCIRSTGKDGNGSYTWGSPYSFAGTDSRDTGLAVMNNKPVIFACLNGPTKSVAFMQAKDGEGADWQPPKVLADVDPVTPVSACVVKSTTAVVYFDGGLKYVRYPTY